MHFTPAVLAVLVEDRHRTVAREVAFARHAGLRQGVAGFVHLLGDRFIALSNVLDAKPGVNAVVIERYRR